jgi:hypothetical protein
VSACEAALDFGPFNHAQLLSCWLGRAYLDLRLFQHARLLRCRGGLGPAELVLWLTPLAGVPAFAAIYDPVGPVPPVAAHGLRFAVHQLAAACMFDRIAATSTATATVEIQVWTTSRRRWCRSFVLSCSLTFCNYFAVCSLVAKT